MPAAQFEPRFPFIVTGDGQVVQLRSKNERTNEQGVEGYDVAINPSDEVIFEYDLQDEDFDEFGFIHRWYPKTVLQILRDDPVKGMYVLYTDINGQDTAFSRSIITHREIIEGQQKHINVLKARNARLWHDLRLMMSQQEEYMRKNVDLIKQAKRLQTGFDEDSLGMDEPSAEMPR